MVDINILQFIYIQYMSCFGISCCSDDTVINQPRRQSKTIISEPTHDQYSESDETTGSPSVSDMCEPPVLSKENLLIRISSEINLLKNKATSYDDLPIDLTNINVPRMVVIGTQTAGKSTLINKLIGYDLLPTGNNMVTRSPVLIHLEKISHLYPSEETLHISYVRDGNSVDYYTCQLACLNYSTIKKMIEDITKKITSSKFSISTSPITIKIKSHTVSPMLLIDLPGMVTMARGDKGQQQNIVEDIKNLTIDQITQTGTLVLLVMQAKLDLETDVALPIIKKIREDNKTIKAIGIMTKPDLMNMDDRKQFDECVGSNTFGPSVNLDYGYFVVNNLNDTDSWYSEYYGKKSQIVASKRYGIKQLSQFCKRRHMNMLIDSMSSIRQGLEVFKSKLTEICPQINEELEKQNEKQLFIDTNIAILEKLIVSSIDSTGQKHNMGAALTVIMNNFKNQVNALDPFSKTNLPDDKLQKIIDSYEEYIPTTSHKHSRILKNLLADEEMQPVIKLKSYAWSCIEQINAKILETIQMFLNDKTLDLYPTKLNSYQFQIKDFPKLHAFIIKTTNSILSNNAKTAIAIIERQLIIDEIGSYLTENKLKKKEVVVSLENRLNQCLEKDNCDAIENSPKVTIQSFGTGITVAQMIEKQDMPSTDDIRTLTTQCYADVVDIFYSTAIKAITADLLHNLKLRYAIEMFREFKNFDQDIEVLFYESVESVKQKRTIMEFNKDVDGILKDIDSLISYK